MMNQDDEEVVVNSEIKKDSSYVLDDFKVRTGLGDAGVRKARRSGLKVRYAHNRGFILGADWIQYLEDQTTVPPGPAEGVDPRQKKLFEEEDSP
jgi:hypothetical protein